MKHLLILLICLSSLFGDECDSTKQQEYCVDDRSRTGIAIVLVITTFLSIIVPIKLSENK